MSASELDLFDLSSPDKLHIGGECRIHGWKVLNIADGAHVDFCCDLRDLSQFADASFDVIYASHVLEHFGYQRELPVVMRGIHRILRSHGRFMISVPDLEALAKLLLAESDPIERVKIMRYMFGGQLHMNDFHLTGFTVEILAFFLHRAGFRDYFRVQEFNITRDTSQKAHKGTPMSLNVIAVKS